MTTIKISRRNANYSKMELDCLVRYLEENPDLVNLKIGSQYSTAEDFRVAWDEVADKISSIGGYFGNRRTGQEIKRKWADLKSRVKAKAASLAIEVERPDGEGSSIKFSPVEERVLAIISQDIDTSHSSGSKTPSVKVFSFHHDSNSEDRMSDFGDKSVCLYVPDEADDTSVADNANESEIFEEIKLSGNQDKKRRISEAFSATNADKKALGLKRVKVITEEQQLQELCNSQLEMNAEIRSIKETLKKCQLSIEKIALLKRAELRLKCAKYGVEFEDLFD